MNLRLPPDRVRIPDFLVMTSEPDLFVEEVPVAVGEVLSPSTRREDLVIKAEEYAAAGIGQYCVVDPEARSVDVHANADGHGESLAVIDERYPTATVEVGEHGSVQVDLAAILDG